MLEVDIKPLSALVLSLLLSAVRHSPSRLPHPKRWHLPSLRAPRRSCLRAGVSGRDAAGMLSGVAFHAFPPFLHELQDLVGEERLLPLASRFLFSILGAGSSAVVTFAQLMTLQA